MEVSNVRALPYFDVNTEQMDVSKKGLGACLIQKGKVICYASRPLTKTELNYQNLERERHLEPYGKWKSSIIYWKGIYIGNQPEATCEYLQEVQEYKDTYHLKLSTKMADIPVADALSHVTPMDPDDNIRVPIIAVNMITA